MFCPKCGSNNFDQSKFCTKCGAELIANQAPSPTPPVELQYKSQFVSPDEHTVAILGNSMAQTFLSTGDLSSSFAVLSNKRVYFHGKAFVRNGKRFSVRKENRIVDVQDVTGTGFIYNNPVWMAIVGIICSIGTIIALILTLIWSGNDEDYILGFSITGAALIAAVVFLLFYRFKRRTLFEISFAGGGIAFNVQWFPAEEAQNFQNALKQTSDTAKTKRAQQSSYTPAGSVADEIEKLAKLMSQGLITQEEFAQQKRALVGSQMKNNMQ